MPLVTIQDYSPPGEQAPRLVEDDSGALALVLSPEQADQGFADATWKQALQDGAAYVLVERADGWHGQTTDQFLANRVEYQALGLVAARRLRPAAEPSLHAVMAARGIQVSQARFVHLHCHSDFSKLDGYSYVRDLVTAAVADGHPALAITDHGIVSAHPDQAIECAKAEVRPIFAIEAYLQPDRRRRTRSWKEVVDGKEVNRSDAREARNGYWHVCLYAMDDPGLLNLWAASTESFRSGNYDGKPRMDWEVLETYGAGLIATTGCLKGPVAHPLLQGDEMQARMNLARLMELFPDRLYVEIHTNSGPDQVLVNKKLVQLARDFDLPMIAVSDSHYTTRDEAPLHKAWLAISTGTDLTEETGMFGDGLYHFHTADEVAAALAYLGEDVVEESMRNTVLLAERCDAHLPHMDARPVYSRGPNGREEDARRLREAVAEGWDKRVVRRGKAAPEVYEARRDHELSVIIDQEYPGYFLVTGEIVRWMKDNGIRVGPGRGSGGGCLVAYSTGIIEMDPVEYGIPFERFMTPQRKDPPDFDIDVPDTKRPLVISYCKERWGADQVVRIGTHGRLRTKQAIQDALRVMRPLLELRGVYVDMADFKVVSEVISEYEATLAGADVEWGPLFRTYGDVLEPIRARWSAIFDLAQRLEGHLRSYGRHASGYLISTDESLSWLPLRAPGKDDDKSGVSEDPEEMVTQFDYRQCERLGLIKYDFLGLRNLRTIQKTVDRVEAREGRVIDLYGWDEELLDPQVWQQISDGHTVGIFQVDTASGVKISKRLKPCSIDDMAVLVAINRPGPLKSGLAETYFRRRDGEEPVRYADPRLEEDQRNTYGTIIFQEQVMEAAHLLAGYDRGEADAEVRKPVAKKLREKIKAAGEKLIARAVAFGTDRQVIETLWEQIKEFANYAFGKAHSYNYSTVAYWTAWLKTHYPVDYMVSCLSDVKDERRPDFINEARRLGIEVLPPDINESNVDFDAVGTRIRYGLSQIKKLTGTPAAQIVAGRPYKDIDEFLEKNIFQGSKVNMGHVLALARLGAFDSIYPNRRALERRLGDMKDGEDARCVDWEAEAPAGVLPCRFDWANEPREDQKGKPTGAWRGRAPDKEWVPKPPPAKCTVGCREYRRRPMLAPEDVTPYTDEDIRQIEREMLGVWLSSTPFDRLPPEALAMCKGAEDLERGGYGKYVVAGIVSRVSPKLDRNSNQYAWVDLDLPDGRVNTVCWASAYSKYRRDLRPDELVVVKLVKKRSGVEIVELATT